MRWEESKKWQAKVEKVKNLLKEKERENESLSKQLSTLRDLYSRSVYTSPAYRHWVSVSWDNRSSLSYMCFPFLFMYRLEQEKGALQKKLRARGVTADQVVGVRFTELEKEMEELKKKNSELETELASIRYRFIFSKVISTVQTVVITACKTLVTGGYGCLYGGCRWPAQNIKAVQ